MSEDSRPSIPPPEPRKVLDPPRVQPTSGVLARTLRALFLERRLPTAVSVSLERFLAKAGFQLKRVEVGGLRAYVRRDSWDPGVLKKIIVDQDYTMGGFGFGSDATVVDIGANIGAFAMLAGRMAPAGRVIAFEPGDANFQLLKRNVEMNRLANVTIRRQAVAGEAGTLRLYHGSQGALHSTVPGRLSGESYEEVPATTLDAVFSDHHIERCDFLKLDCEGAEYEIIYAASPKTLARIHRIAMEYHDRVDKVTKAKELVAFLIGHGFRIVDFTDFVGHDCGFIRMER